MSDLTDPPLTIPAGTQVVVRVAVHDPTGTVLAPAGAVGVGGGGSGGVGGGGGDAGCGSPGGG
ncbi:MAG: hypothetical protein HGA19_23260, partial [Oscillochloris sp.]|nr:hypothetical protein [Oscillochloris sp.]